METSGNQWIGGEGLYLLHQLDGIGIAYRDTWGRVYDSITGNLQRGLTEGRSTLNVSSTVLWTEAKVEKKKARGTLAVASLCFLVLQM